MIYKIRPCFRRGLQYLIIRLFCLPRRSFAEGPLRRPVFAAPGLTVFHERLRYTLHSRGMVSCHLLRVFSSSFHLPDSVGL